MAQAESSDRDINDIFEDLLFCEENLAQEGFAEGYEQSKNSRDSEGYHLGYHKGLQIGSELGFCLGIIECILEDNSVKKIEIPEKVLKELHKLKSLIENVPQYNELDLDIEATLANIRGQYRKLCINLKLDRRNLSKIDKLAF